MEKLNTPDPDIAQFEKLLAWARKLPAGRYNSQVIFVSPALAAYILANLNYGNRRLRRSAVAQWRARFREGRYVLTGDAISITPDGQLNNGQHRLTGVVESAIGAEFLFFFNESRDAFRIRDTGAARTAADVLSTTPPNAEAVAAVARRVLQWKSGRPFGGKHIDVDEIDDFVNHHEPKLQEAVRRALRVAHATGCARAATATAFYLIAKCSAQSDEIDQFVAVLCDGNDQVKHLRDHLIRKRWGNAGVLTAALILGWNLWVRRKTITSPKRCDSNSNFPTIL